MQYDLNVVSIRIFFITLRYSHSRRTWQMFTSGISLLIKAKLISLLGESQLSFEWCKNKNISSAQLLSINEWPIHNKWWLMNFCITMNFKLHIKNILKNNNMANIFFYSKKLIWIKYDKKKLCQLMSILMCYHVIWKIVI